MLGRVTNGGSRRWRLRGWWWSLWFDRWSGRRLLGRFFRRFWWWCWLIRRARLIQQRINVINVFKLGVNQSIRPRNDSRLSASASDRASVSSIGGCVTACFIPCFHSASL